MIKIRNYTDEELQYIKDNYSSLTLKEIAKTLKKSEDSISYAITKLGLKKQIHIKWTDEENQFLKDNYLIMTNAELAKELNRSFISVSAQLDRLKLTKAKFWTKEEEKYLIDNYINMTHQEMGKVLNRTDGAIRSKCFELNLYKKDVPWTDEELNYIKNNYREKTFKEMSQYLNRTDNAIRLQCSRMGLKKTPYVCDYHYFENINSEEKAYWLGFLLADGWINKNENTNAGTVGIELQYGDIEHLKKFNKSIKGNYKITDRWRPCFLSTKDKKKKHHACVIRVFSITMYDSLIKLGFTNNKSFDGSIPKIRKDLFKHLIRGYFDGNGCVCCTDKKFVVYFSTASEQLNQDIIKILEEQNIPVSNYSYINEYGTTMYAPTINRIQDKIKFLDWIYKDSSIYLDRKFKKYIKVKEKYTLPNQGSANQK